MRRSHGFTLIEMMIVVAIVGIMAVIALWQISDSKPFRELREASDRTNMAFLLGRTRAIRNGQIHKVCLLPAGSAAGVDQGRVIVVGCIPGRVCDGDPATDNPICNPATPSGVNPARVCTVPAGVAPPVGEFACDGGFAGDWGLVSALEGGPDNDVNLDAARASTGRAQMHQGCDPVTVASACPNTVGPCCTNAANAFVDAQGNPLATQPAWLEVAYDSGGVVDLANTCDHLGVSNPVFLSAGVKFTNASAKRTRGIRWTLSGSTFLKGCQPGGGGTLQCNVED